MGQFGKLAAATLALLAVSPAVAQTAPAPAAPTAAKHYSTQDTTIGDLLADPNAKAVVDKHIPGFSENPQISMAAGMTLRVIQQMAGDKVTVEALDAIDADLAKIPAK